MAIYERELRQMKKLNPPQRERAAYAALLNALNQQVLAWGRMVVFPNGAAEILEKNIAPSDRLMAEVSRRLGATACVDAFSNVKTKQKATRTGPKPG